MTTPTLSKPMTPRIALIKLASTRWNFAHSVDRFPGPLTRLWEKGPHQGSDLRAAWDVRVRDELKFLEKVAHLVKDDRLGVSDDTGWQLRLDLLRWAQETRRIYDLVVAHFEANIPIEKLKSPYAIPDFPDDLMATVWECIQQHERFDPDTCEEMM